MGKDVSNSQHELHTYIAALVKSGRFPDEEAAYAWVLELLQQDDRSTHTREKRRGGQWKGQVTIAPDFNDLPDDLTESFGMR